MQDAIASFQSKGVQVIVSSQTPDDPFLVGTTAPEFVAEAEAAAEATGASYIDHFDFVLREFENLGNDTVATFYPVDHLHTNTAGADVVAQTFVRAVLCAGETNPLFFFVNDTSVVPGERSVGFRVTQKLTLFALATCA